MSDLNCNIMRCIGKIIFEKIRKYKKYNFSRVCRSSIFFPMNSNHQQFLDKLNATGEYRLFNLYILTLSNVVLTRKKICFRNSLHVYYLQGKFAICCFEALFIDLYLRASMLHSDIVLSILVYPVYSMDFYSVIV